MRDMFVKGLACPSHQHNRTYDASSELGMGTTSSP